MLVVPSCGYVLPTYAECVAKNPYKMVLPMRIELMTSPLPRECTTTVLRQLKSLEELP